MRITFIPQRRDDVLTLSRHGDVLTVTGDVLDFSPLPDGATLPASAISNAFVYGPVERMEGEICLSLLVPCRDPEAWKLPPIAVTVTGNGPVDLPVFDRAMEAESNADCSFQVGYCRTETAGSD